MDLALFAQDQWTMRNLTLNLGVRFDYLNDYNPAQTRPAGEFTPEISFEAMHNVPNWKDINPRLGAAYDLFGNGKTALKGSVGRYVKLQTTDIANRTNPQRRLPLTTRTWSDSFFGPADPHRQLCARLRFPQPRDQRRVRGDGQPELRQRRPQTRYATDVTEGWHVRQYNWQISAGIQHELGRASG